MTESGKISRFKMARVLKCTSDLHVQMQVQRVFEDQTLILLTFFAPYVDLSCETSHNPFAKKSTLLLSTTLIHPIFVQLIHK